MPVIRVLLHKQTEKQSVTFTSNRRLIVEVFGPSGASRSVSAGTPVTVRRRGQRLVVNDRAFSNATAVRLFTTDGGRLTVQDRTYRGNIRVYRNDRKHEGIETGGLMVVNHVPINKYLWAVLGAELLPRWTGDEINRTQAVAARTYTLLEIKERAAEGPARFDVYDSQRSQVYSGMGRERPATKRGVQDTIGEVLFFGDNRLVPTYFSSTCGGHTSPPRPDFSWHEDPVPEPLKGVSCPWDDVSKHHRWTAAIPGSVLKRALFPEANGRRIYDTAVTARKSEQRVHRIAFRLDTGDVKRMSGPVFRRKIASFRSALESERRRDRFWIRSTKFRVRKQSNGAFHFRGRGWGHGVGMCQYGAFGASQEGYEYTEILSHYYQGSRIRTLYPVNE